MAIVFALSEMVDQLSLSRLCSVDLKQLHFAVAAADHGSIRQAAVVMSVRHSLLSRSIRQLENMVGVVIFERSGRGVKATTAGRIVLKMARSILEQVDVLVATGKSSDQGDTGHLSIGFCTSISAGNLRGLLTDFAVRYPSIGITAIERSSTRLAAALRNGVADLAIVGGEVPLPGANVRALWNERVLVAMPAAHAMAASQSVHWNDLRKEKMLITQYDQFEDLLLSKLPSPLSRPKIERHDVSRCTLRSLTSMNAGISLVLESDVCTGSSGLVYREVHDENGSTLIGFSAHWEDDNENPALACFLKLLADRYPTSE